MQDVFELLVPHRQGHYQDERVWTDATYSRSSWVWSHNGNYISSRSFRNLVFSHSTTRACGFAMVHTSSGGIIFSPTTTEDLIADRCSATYLPLFAGATLCSSACDDVDTKACELLANKRPDLCSDPCLSTLCNRYCGHCPVKCYQCDEVNFPQNCTNIVDCPSKDHYCYTTQSFASDFREIYRMGCALKSICSLYLGPDTNRRNIDVNGACCTQDNCNNRLPYDIITSQTLPSQSVSTVNCYTCDDINSLTDCKNTTHCASGSECFAYETLTKDFRQVYRVGCVQQQFCSRFTGSGTGQSIIGRRDEGFILKGSCCTSNLCNDHINFIQPPTTSIPQQGGQFTLFTNKSLCQDHTTCPIGYSETRNSCYMVGPNELDWGDAKEYCEKHCGRLIDFANKDELLAVTNLLIPNVDGQFQDEFAWVGAKYINREWVWTNNGNLVNNKDFDSLTSSHPRTHICGFVRVYMDTNPGELREELFEENCDRLFSPLCEAPKV
ncbi:unnamed protein product [Mytilus edulis]|uniref:C-type lectin domain-containing protein n=1 Tax=Mytilus edulis TaxID=6550 RepID=A0A8S3UAM2_MYTED|nr:unnamed protein product [Mytilus edulis]